MEDGVNGYIYDRTPEELADAIRNMLGLSEEACRTMGRKSLEKARTMFDAMGYVESLENWHHRIKETN